MRQSSRHFLLRHFCAESRFQYSLADSNGQYFRHYKRTSYYLMDEKLADQINFACFDLSKSLVNALKEKLIGNQFGANSRVRVHQGKSGVEHIA